MAWPPAPGLELGAATALLTGFLEIGGGIGALRGCSPTAANFALCALIIGWGGLSVHMQTAAATAGAGVKTARHLAGRLMSAAFSAIYAWRPSAWPGSEKKKAAPAQGAALIIIITM